VTRLASKSGFHHGRWWVAPSATVCSSQCSTAVTQGMLVSSHSTSAVMRMALGGKGADSTMWISCVVFWRTWSATC